MTQDTQPQKVVQQPKATGLAATAFIADQVKAAPPAEAKVEELEPFKYNFEAQTHWVGPSGYAKEGPAEEFPVLWA